MFVTDYKNSPIPTYGGDSVLMIPAEDDTDESAFLSRLANDFVAVQFAADDMPEDERVSFVTKGLKTFEARGHG